jgi:hypothetical protein
VDQKTLDAIIPITSVDRMIGTYTGGINTGKYYAVLYGGDAGGQIPVDTLIIEDPRYNPNGKQNTQTKTNNPNSITPTETLDFLSPPNEGNETTLQRETSVDEQEYVAQVQQEAPVTQPASQDGGFLYSAVNAAFSIAVVISIMGLIAVVYIIIRTRQLHHHEHDVRHAGEHGHGGPGAGHAGAAGHGHDTHAAHASGHAAPTHDTHEPASVAHTTDDDDATYEFETAVPGSGSDDHVVHESHDAPIAHLDAAEDTFEIPAASDAAGLTARWASIKQRAQSDDENDLRFALMDVELVLEDALRARGINGSSLTEMLNSKEAEDLATYQVARNAHVLHEQIVDGTVPLSQDSMHELIGLYTKVFKELHV